MNCPKCKSKSAVLETRWTTKGARRRRVCMRKRCQFRFTTIETVVDYRSGKRRISLRGDLLLISKDDSTNIRSAVARLRKIFKAAT